jgi:transposase-like protein
MLPGTEKDFDVRAQYYDQGIKSPADKASVPAGCPACKSTDLVTTSKTVDEATYWRCRACGEVWNAGRRREYIRPARQW